MSEEFTEGQLTAMLPFVYALKEQRDTAKSQYDNACEPYRDWLKAHPDDFLRDGETGYFAKHIPNPLGERADLPTLAEDNPQLVIWLALHGCLKLEPKGWKGVKGKFAEVLDVHTWVEYGQPKLIIDKEA